MKKAVLKKSITLVFAIFICFIFSGCYNYREVNQMLIVAGIAYDINLDTNQFYLNIEGVGFTGGEQREMVPILIAAEGDSIFDTSRNSTTIGGKKAYWRHKQVIIIGETMGEYGIFSIIDMITRDADPRMSVYLVVSKEESAAEIIQNKVAGYNITSTGIYDILENYKSLSTYLPVKVYEANTDLLSEGISLVLPTVYLIDNNGEKSVEVSGSAVFDDDKIIGYLDADQTKYLMFVKNKIEGGLITTEDPQNGKTITLEIFKNNTEITPQMVDGKNKSNHKNKNGGIACRGGLLFRTYGCSRARPNIRFGKRNY